MFESREIGLYFEHSSSRPFSLKIGITFEIFELSTYIPVLKERFIISTKDQLGQI